MCDGATFSLDAALFYERGKPHGSRRSTRLSVVLVAVFGVVFLGERLSGSNWLGVADRCRRGPRGLQRRHLKLCTLNNDFPDIM
jgi:hypothetical protein